MIISDDGDTWNATAFSSAERNSKARVELAQIRELVVIYAQAA